MHCTVPVHDKIGGGLVIRGKDGFSFGECMYVFRISQPSRRPPCRRSPLIITAKPVSGMNTTSSRNTYGELSNISRPRMYCTCTCFLQKNQDFLSTFIPRFYPCLVRTLLLHIWPPKTCCTWVLRSIFDLKKIQVNLRGLSKSCRFIS